MRAKCLPIATDAGCDGRYTNDSAITKAVGGDKRRQGGIFLSSFHELSSGDGNRFHFLESFDCLPAFGAHVPVTLYDDAHFDQLNTPLIDLGFSISKSPTSPSTVTASTMASFDRLGQFPQGSSVSTSPALVSGLDQLKDGRLNKVKYINNKLTDDFVVVIFVVTCGQEILRLDK